MINLSIWYKNYLFTDLIFFFKFFFFLNFFFFFYLIFFLINNYFNIFVFYINNFYFNVFKRNTLFIVFFLSIYLHIIYIYCYLFFYNNFFIINNTFINKNISLVYQNINTSLFTISIFYYDIFNISISKFNLNFILLFSILYPIIFLVMGYDYTYKNFYFYILVLLIFIFSYILLLVESIIFFYFIYELILILVFSSMYLSSNSRGSIEAALFFLGWAILGSIFVSMGFILLVVLTNSIYFNDININILNSEEVYYLYLLFFFGFGTKLSTWPFWYWLPKAHVEVSTSMSIFLSCVLIKLSLYCLIKIKFILSSEISYNLFLFVTLLCVLDITFRLINLKDMKAIIAYSSVLHTNLLLTLIHLDNFKILNNSILYIWGHSLSTACMFLCVNLIESMFGTRNILQISGLWYSSPLLSLLLFWSLISFLDIPVTLFFWGEIWLWVVLITKIFFIGSQIMFLSLVFFTSIFFKIWWNILFGTPSKIIIINDVHYLNIINILIFLISVQLFLGFFPTILISSIGYIY